MWSKQPPSEKVSYISEKLDFWWSIPQKITSIVSSSASNNQTIRIRQFVWGNWALEAVEASKVAEAAEVNEAAEVTIEDFRVIQINLRTNIALFWCFGKKIFDKIMITHVEF